MVKAEGETEVSDHEPCRVTGCQTETVFALTFRDDVSDHFYCRGHYREIGHQLDWSRASYIGPTDEKPPKKEGWVDTGIRAELAEAHKTIAALESDLTRERERAEAAEKSAALATGHTRALLAELQTIRQAWDIEGDEDMTTAQILVVRRAGFTAKLEAMRQEVAAERSRREAAEKNWADADECTQFHIRTLGMYRSAICESLGIASDLNLKEIQGSIVSLRERAEKAERQLDSSLWARIAANRLETFCDAVKVAGVIREKLAASEAARLKAEESALTYATHWDAANTVLQEQGKRLAELERLAREVVSTVPSAWVSDSHPIHALAAFLTKESI